MVGHLALLAILGVFAAKGLTGSVYQSTSYVMNRAILEVILLWCRHCASQGMTSAARQVISAGPGPELHCVQALLSCNVPCL